MSEKFSARSREDLAMKEALQTVFLGSQATESSTKATNPKDAASELRLPLHLIPRTAELHMALALYEGAWKYGEKNWRKSGVRTSVYVSAAKRHLTKYLSGRDKDMLSGVHHLGSVMACCAIILDAEDFGVLEDDRFNQGSTAAPEVLDEIAQSVMAQIQRIFQRFCVAKEGEES